MIIADKKLLDRLSAKAKASKRKRSMFNFHKDASDPMHRMLNAMEPGTYVPPHKHENPDKREAFWVLRGKIALILFSDDGSIRQQIIMGSQTGNYGAEIPARTWHCLVCLKENSVAYEVKDGPWHPQNDKKYPSWAPKENTKQANAFVNKMMQFIN
ncbi:MAG: WbuC family cupin fold metalloprotein [Bacteroidales bacterium]